MNHLRLVVCLFLAAFGSASLLLSGCEPREDIVTTDRDAVLTASVDTVFFDTVFVSRGSVTKRFWVFNRNPKAVRVDEISLAGAASPTARWEIIIDGRPGPARRDFELRGRDSLLVLAKVTIDPNAVDTAFLVLDSVRLRANGTTRYVKLQAFGENATYYNAPQGFAPVVACNDTWTARRPIVLLKTTIVDSACLLTVEPGTRIYLAAGASLLVRGSLRCGAIGDGVPAVTFRGLRRDDFYDPRDPRFTILDNFTAKYAFVPGQWGAVIFQPSEGAQRTAPNELLNTVIRNPTVGVLIDNPRFLPGHRVRLENCIIRTAFTAGIYGIGAAQEPGGLVEVTNSVIAHCGERAVVGLGGGTWRFAHTTIDMGQTVFSRRETEALAFNNGVELAPGVVRSKKTTLSFENSILWSGLRDNDGELLNEILLLREGGVRDSSYVFRHNILQTAFPRFNTEGQTYGRGVSGTNALNADPDFRNPSSLRFDLRLDSLTSPARRLGGALSPTIPVDILRETRDQTNPSAGAYESKP
jgi:hypothetical protein